MQHKRVACGKEDLLRERLRIPSTEEYVGELDKAVLRYTISRDNGDAKECSSAYEAPWILRYGNDLCDLDVSCASSQGAVAYMAPLGALKDLVRIAWSAMAHLSTLNSYPVLQVTHPDPLRSAAIDLCALEFTTPVIPPDELF